MKKISLLFLILLLIIGGGGSLKATSFKMDILFSPDCLPLKVILPKVMPDSSYFKYRCLTYESNGIIPERAILYITTEKAVLDFFYKKGEIVDYFFIGKLKSNGKKTYIGYFNKKEEYYYLAFKVILGFLGQNNKKFLEDLIDFSN